MGDILGELYPHHASKRQGLPSIQREQLGDGLDNNACEGKCSLGVREFHFHVKPEVLASESYEQNSDSL